MNRIGCALFIILLGLLWLPEAKSLWITWNGDASLSHGPLMPFLALGHLWTNRQKLRLSKTPSLPGFLFLFLVVLVYIGAVWSDVAFMKILCLIAMLMGSIWFACGWKALQATAGSVIFLIFMIPLPMVLNERLSFPMQLLSSTYAALLAGICGLPIHREGVYLSIMPDTASKPIYSIMVAQQCSGMTSFIVLLVLAYLVAYHTPLKMGWRVLIVVAVLPLTLLLNAVRLTLILLAGAYYSPTLAAWIHDHETPFLVFFCSIGLAALRHGLMVWTRLPPMPEGDTIVST